MASHVFHEIYLHLNWHAKDSRPVITETLEPEILGFLENRCRKASGVFFHGIGGTPTHIHMAINIEPQVCISDLVGDLKGSCSAEINKRSRDCWFDMCPTG